MQNFKIFSDHNHRKSFSAKLKTILISAVLNWFFEHVRAQDEFNLIEPKTAINTVDEFI